MGILEVPEQVSVGSKTQPSLSSQTAAQRWRQLQESGDLNQGPTLLEFHCFFSQEVRTHIPPLLGSQGCPEN